MTQKSTGQIGRRIEGDLEVLKRNESLEGKRTKMFTPALLRYSQFLSPLSYLRLSDSASLRFTIPTTCS